MSEIVYYFNSNSGFYSVLLCAITIVVTGIIGFMQYKQNKKMLKYQEENDLKMKEFQEKVNKRDENRHDDYINSLAYSFIHDCAIDIDYLPLCVIACMYNRSYNYRRPIYNKFCSCSVEVQDRILKIRGININRRTSQDFYSTCMNAIIKCINDNNLYKNNNIYYENGKYFERTLTYKGHEKKSDFFKERQFLTDILAEYVRDKDIEYPIDIICKNLNFGNISEDKVYMMISEIFKYISIYYSQREKSFIMPDVTENTDDVYLEDVFLSALFEIYYNLVMDYKE